MLAQIMWEFLEVDFARNAESQDKLSQFVNIRATVHLDSASSQLLA